MSTGNNFKLNVQLLRVAANKKQTECAAAIGLTSTAWSNYENGRSQPSLRDLLKISKLFEVTLSELVEEDLSKRKSLIAKAKKHTPAASAIDNLLQEPSADYIIKRLNELEKQVKELKKVVGKN